MDERERRSGVGWAPHPELASAGEIARHYLGDVVYGANDGIITTFAIVAGAAGAALSPVVVLVLGLANLLADGFSMAASNVLSIRSKAAVERMETGHVSEPYAFRHGLATFLAFLLAGAVPLLAFILPFGGDRFRLAATLTLATLFAVGAARTAVTRGRWWSSGLEMLFIGAAAAAVAYAVGRLTARLTGIAPV